MSIITNDPFRDMERAIHDHRSYTDEFLQVLIARANAHAQLQQAEEIARLNDRLQNSLQVIARVMNIK